MRVPVVISAMGVVIRLILPTCLMCAAETAALHPVLRIPSIFSLS